MLEDMADSRRISMNIHHIAPQGNVFLTFYMRSI